MFESTIWAPILLEEGWPHFAAGVVFTDTRPLALTCTSHWLFGKIHSAIRSISRSQPNRVASNWKEQTLSSQTVVPANPLISPNPGSDRIFLLYTSRSVINSDRLRPRRINSGRSPYLILNIFLRLVTICVVRSIYASHWFHWSALPAILLGAWA